MIMFEELEEIQIDSEKTLAVLSWQKKRVLALTHHSILAGQKQVSCCQEIANTPTQL